MNGLIPVKEQTITAPTIYPDSSNAVNNTRFNVSGENISSYEDQADFSLDNDTIEKTFLSIHPSGAIAIFEEQLRQLKCADRPTDKYVEKLIDLKKKLDTLIIEWV